MIYPFTSTSQLLYFNSFLSLYFVFQFVDNLDDLSLILDPDGHDVHIDISTYQAGINEWIEDIRKRRYVQLLLN